MSSKLGAALDALVAAGANQMNGVNFAIQDTAPLLAEARAEAVADAKAKAETYAKAAGVSLGPILSISENGNRRAAPGLWPRRWCAPPRRCRWRRARKASPPRFPLSGKSTETPYIEAMENPFFEDWTAPFGAPPLDRIRPEHFPPAYAARPGRA